MEVIVSQQHALEEAHQVSQHAQDFIQTVFEEGTAPNTIRAFQQDMRYFQCWYELKYQQPPKLPCSIEALTEFIADHFGGMDPRLDEAMVLSGTKSKLGLPHPNTVQRRLASLSTAHRGHESNPCQDPRIKLLLSKAKKRAIRQGAKVRKKKALTKDLLEMLLDTCGSSLLDKRDKAILLVGFSSGGRRRSEIVSLRYEDLEKVGTGYHVWLRRSKTDQDGEGMQLPIFGAAAAALSEWLEASEIKEGFIFRGITKYGTVRGHSQMNGRSVNRIVKLRAEQAGFTPEQIKELGAHSLRSGFVTQCGRQGINRGDAMALSGHKTQKIFDEYYQSGELEINPAAKLF